MAILIDPPVWPAHGTVWSHLITDSNLDELHTFAKQLKIPRRGFDIDHYDVPESLYSEAITLGARSVSAKDVVHALRAAGLRVKRADRAAKRPVQRLEYLRAQWRQLGEASIAGVTGGAGGEIRDRWLLAGETLLSRWSESHRTYHDVQHLEDVLLALDQLEMRGAQVATETLLAAWFHDAVYLGESGSDEHASAKLALVILGAFGVNPAVTQRVVDMITATIPAQIIADPPPPLALLLDADLAIFAASTARYDAYAAAVRREYARVSEPDFAKGRVRILETYAAQETIYRTSTAQLLWEKPARANLAREIALLRNRICDC